MNSVKIKPKNWERYQHYKDRSPPWIKLHRDLLNDRKYLSLPLASKALAPLLWLLASEDKEGFFDASVEELHFRLRMDVKDIRTGLKALIDNGFFIGDSIVLAEGLQDATPEGEGEAEAEAEVEAEGETQSFAGAKAKRVSGYQKSAIEVFEHWKVVMQSPRSKLDDKRIKIICDRFKEGYSIADLKDAIDGCALDDWHMNRAPNSKGLYNGIHNICKDGAKVDGFISKKTNPTRQKTEAEVRGERNRRVIEEALGIEDFTTNSPLGNFGAVIEGEVVQNG